MAESRVTYSEKGKSELLKLLKDKEKQLFEMKMGLAQGKIKNVHAKVEVRREIARIKTALRAIELGDRK